ncbi:MAG: hypothetical protein HQ546_00505 [Planctomycetes bacterium]|nr:hypothetical protein [Planctomycetota bacterium]
MKNKWMILLSFAGGVLLTLLLTLLILAMGVINMGTDVKPGLIERTIAPWVFYRSEEKRAPKEKNPYVGAPAAIATGRDHYRENCIISNEAPDLAGAELSKGLNPPAPSLGKREDDTPDEELFWVINIASE